jgi:hypothetical protein
MEGDQNDTYSGIFDGKTQTYGSYYEIYSSGIYTELEGNS